MQYTLRYVEVRTHTFKLNIDGDEDAAKEIGTKMLDYDEFYERAWAYEDCSTDVVLVDDEPTEDWSDEVAGYLKDPRIITTQHSGNEKE